MLPTRFVIEPESFNWDSNNFSPQRDHKCVYEELGVPEENATDFVNASIDETQKRVDKLQKNKPKMPLDPNEFRENVQNH